MKKTDLIVIGAGPAGLMAAGTAAKRGLKVLIIEKNEKIGRKLLITGKGRCNITNDCDIDTFIKSVPVNSQFLYSAINAFSPQDTINFFNNNGVLTKVERGNRVFPKSDKSVDIVDVLYKFVKDTNCEIIKDSVKSLIIKQGELKGIICKSEKIIYSNSIIIATGGKSYPITGSTGDGYTLAIQSGHSIVPLKASLVPLVAKEFWCQELQGLSLKNVKIKLIDNKIQKEIYEEFGEMLFTHFGISGPIVLSLSSNMKEINENKYSVIIDLKPGLSFEKLDLRIRKDFLKFKNKDILNSLGDLLPKKLIPVIIKLIDLDPHIKCNSIKKKMRYKLVYKLKNLKINIKKFRPIQEAIITSGGINTNEINPKTMESKILNGLYFAGEIIDVDAYTGGFNLQIAFSTGYLAGTKVINRL